MSIETEEGNSFINSYHLGTDEKLARQMIEERFNGRVKKNLPTTSIALMQYCLGNKHKIVDVYYGNGCWHNDLESAYNDYIYNQYCVV